MFDLLAWYKGATFSDIMQLIFIATAFGFIRAILFIGNNLKESTEKSIKEVSTSGSVAINNIAVQVEKMGVTLTKLTDVVMEIKTEMTSEINRIEMRIVMAEKDIQHHTSQLDSAVERRREHRD